MKHAVTGARLLLGLVFTLFGINYFVPFLPPPELNEAAGQFFGALIGSGYLMALVKITEIVGGVMLLCARGVPLALTLLAPVVVNIVAFHIFLDPAGLPIAIIVLALEVFLAWSYRSSYSGVLNFSAQPTT